MVVGEILPRVFVCVKVPSLKVQGFEAARGKFGRVRLYSGALHCVATVLTEEGPRAFYKGSIPALTKVSDCVTWWSCVDHMSLLYPPHRLLLVFQLAFARMRRC